MSLAFVSTSGPFVSLAEAKRQVVEESSDFDDLIASQVAAATSWAEQYTGKAFVSQVWDYTLDDFPLGWAPAIQLPIAPVSAIESIKYYDTDGQEQTWASDAYVVRGLNSTAGVRILPAFGGSYPPTRCQLDGVTVRFTAGYVDGHRDLNNARSAILLIVGNLFANREGQTIGASAASVVNPNVLSLLAPLRGHLV